MRPVALLIGSLLLLQAALVATQAPAENLRAETLPMFDVASVKRNYLPDFAQRSTYRFTPGRLTARNVTLRQLSQLAFSTVADAQLVGGPDWFNSTKFDVDATLPGAPSDQLRLCLRRLLVERFGMVARFDTRVVPVYKLVQLRRDGKPQKALTASRCDRTADLQNNRESTCGRFAFGANSMSGYSVTMTAVAKVITEYSAFTNVDRLVVDETGLAENYTFTIEYSPERENYGLRTAPTPDLPAFSTALQEQLGLKLQPSTQPSRVVVVDRANLPTPD